MSTRIDDQRIFYNEYWKNHQFLNRSKRFRCSAIISAIAKTTISQPKILDLGCGTGWLSSMLGHLGPTVGVDLSDFAIAAATKKYPYVNFLSADISNWACPENEFDIVVSHEVIEHMIDHNKYLDVVYKVLRPKGYLILTTPNPPTFANMAPSERGGWYDQPIENWITIPEMKKLLATRFMIVKLSTIIPGFGAKGAYRIANSRYLRGILRVLGLGDLFDNLCLSLGFGLHIFVVAQKNNMQL